MNKKKIVSILLSLCILSTFIACGKNVDNDNSNNTEVVQENDSPSKVNEEGNCSSNLSSPNNGEVVKKGDWIYFTTNHSNGAGISKIKTDGTGLTKIYSSRNLTFKLNIVSDKIYFGEEYKQNNGVSYLTLKSCTLDGSDVKQISDDIMGDITVVGEYVYYLKYPVKDSETSSIVKMKVDGSDKSIILNEGEYKSLTYDKNKLYYSTSEKVTEENQQYRDYFLSSIDLSDNSVKDKIAHIYRDNVSVRKVQPKFVIRDEVAYLSKCISKSPGNIQTYTIATINLVDNTENILYTIEDVKMLPKSLNVTKDKEVLIGATYNKFYKIKADGSIVDFKEATCNNIYTFEDDDYAIYQDLSRNGRLFKINLDGSDDKPVIPEV